MSWNGDKDLIMLREMAAEGVMHQKPKSRGRGAAWQKVVDSLNPLKDFNVSSRSVRDRYNILAKKHKVRMTKEERSTGEGGDELSELESLLEEVIEIEEETEQRVKEETTTKKNTIDEDKAKAQEMRKRAIESMGETRKRIQGEGKTDQKKRRSASQAADWLERAIEKKQKMDVEENKRQNEERKQHQERQDQFLEQIKTYQQQQISQSQIMEKHFLHNMQQQQQQQQQQQNQQMALMQSFMMQVMEQQQKQTDMMLELFKNLKN